MGLLSACKCVKECVGESPEVDRASRRGLSVTPRNWYGKSARFHPGTHGESASGWACNDRNTEDPASAHAAFQADGKAARADIDKEKENDTIKQTATGAIDKIRLTRWAACPRAEPRSLPRNLAGCSQARPCSVPCSPCRTPSTRSPGRLRWPTDGGTMPSRGGRARRRR